MQGTRSCVLPANVNMFSPSRTYFLVAQMDQNLVLYRSGGGAVWASNTRNPSVYNENVQLAMQQVGL